MTVEKTIISSIKNLEAEDEKKPFLTFITGPRLGQLVEVPSNDMVVGRSADCDLAIEDSAISRKHFKILVQEGEVQLEDLGSTNGTYINGERVTKTAVRDGDKIQLSQNSILELTYLDQTRVLSEKKRYEMGVLDAVTNIYNKRYFMDRIKEEFSHAQRKKRALSLIILDLDFFKRVNDTHGHLAGDLVLQKTCAEISKTVRSDDIFARYGGEEFILLMREAALPSAFELAERIRKIVEEMTIVYEGKPIPITVSCGVATLTPKIIDYISLIAEADRFLYRSKKQGRNRVSGPDLS